MELGGEAQLAEHEPPASAIERGTREVGDEKGHVATVELVAQLEHQPGVAGEAGQVVHRN